MITRMTRSSMLETIRQDYIRTARAKGLKESVITIRHALRNAMIPIVTTVGLQFGFSLGGAVLVETVFSWPGIGRLLVDCIGLKDTPVVVACVLVLATMFTIINLCIDILYAFLDPRIRAQYKTAKEVMRMTGKVKNKNKKKSQAAAVWRRLKKNKMAVLGLIILAVIIFFAVFADVFFDYETLVIQQNASLKLQPPPSSTGWAPTRWAATSWPGSSTAPGSPAGGLCHHRHCHSGGRPAGGHCRLRQPPVDDVIMRVMDIFLAIPSILLSIALVSAMGTSVTNMMLAISISNIPPFARIVRSAVLTIKNEEYIEAARAIGASDKRIILKHILPNCMAPSLCRPRCPSPGPSWPLPASASSAWASARPRRSGVLWSAPAGSISGRPGGCARSRALPSC